MIKFNEISGYTYEYRIFKNGNDWTFLIKIGDIDYAIKISNGVIEYNILYFKKHGLSNGFSLVNKNKEMLKLTYNIGYFISLYVNELNYDKVNYNTTNNESGDVIAKVNNRAFMKYFNEPTIVDLGENKFEITFKNE